MPLLLLAAVAITLLKPSPATLNSSAEKIQNYVTETEQHFKKAQDNDAFISDLQQWNFNHPLLREFQEEGLELFVYQEDSLLFWSDHRRLITLPVNSIPEGVSFLKMKNSWNLVLKSPTDLQQRTLIGLSVIKYQYPFENRFLKNGFAESLNIGNDIDVSATKLPGSVAIYNQKNETLCYLYHIRDELKSTANPLLFIAQLVLLLLAFYFMHYLASRMVANTGFVRAYLYLVVSVVLVRIVMLVLDQPSEFYQLEWFHPRHYAASVFFKSLGDLFVNSVLLAWLALFAAYYLPVTETKKNNPPGLLIIAFCVAVIFLLTAAVVWVFRTLVIDSVISFEVYNILSLSVYSLVGLISISLLLLVHFLTSKFIINYLQNSSAAWRYVVASVFIVGIITLSLAPGSVYWQAIIFSSLWTMFYILALYRLTEYNQILSAPHLLIYIGLYSVLSAYLIENLYEHHERNYRKFFAAKLVTERDYVAEFMFDDIYTRMKEDAFIRNYFINPLIPEKELNDRLNTLYFSGYFNKYDIQSFAFDRNNLPIKHRDSLTIDLFSKLWDTVANRKEKLSYISDSSRNYFYISILNYTSDSALLGTLALQIRPKIYYGQNVYPELLLGDNISFIPQSRRYHYAIYRHDQMVVQQGEYPYPYFWNKDFSFGRFPFRFIDIGEWEHIIYRFGNNMKVIVTERQEGLFEPVATFSYFFSIYFIMAGVILGLYRIVSREKAVRGELNLFSVSFRTRINYSILTMIVASFVIITIVTISYLSEQYDNNYNDRLLRKEKVIHSGIEYFIRQYDTYSDESFKKALNLELVRQSEINNIDINLYNAKGDLLLASQPAIFERGIVSRKMNPAAFHKLFSGKATQVTHEERIGSLNYLATYAPLRNTKGETVAYLGIPYFARSKNINEEVSSFLVALMNVYVFLLICAAILAYFISTSITQPLTIISEKLRLLNLSKRNEPIQWNSKDEIGALVNEYNKMIGELEKSAQELAKGERESAWREMAKQIAHEIKNPLTPMKLSIQYLQRAIDAGDPNITQLSRKVARTLEEQIENLSSIATAFSSFAKMPKTQNELINLNDLLKSVTQLFGQEEKIMLSFTSDVSEPVIYADKNQMLSVFNNLVKNALQSIPEQRTGFVDVHIAEEDSWILVTVSDNGIGIPHDLYDKVFVPNFTTKSSGTGLGLAITKQMVEGAGGRIWFESAENVGTTFFVRLRKKVQL